MAIFWSAKPPAASVRYTWTPPVADGDRVSAYTVSETGAVIDSEAMVGDEIVLFVSGGTAGQTASFEFTADTDAGEILADTVYLPIIAPGASGETARDIVTFALRKIYGLGETPPADAADHALECLSDMLEEWRTSGADVGATSPLDLNTVVYCPKGYMGAIKNNLIVAASEIFDREVTQTVALAARRGLAHVKWGNIPDHREQAVYY